ncbi:MAG: right-handed parallel beta-helix repeat-containing protein [Planctomycetota bacterium]
MNINKSALFSVVLAVSLVGVASAEVVVRGDIGTDKSPFYSPPDLKLKPGWTLITPPNDVTYVDYKEDHPGGVFVGDVNGTGIDLHFDVGTHITLSGRDRYYEFPEAEPLANDYFMSDDASTVAEGMFFMTLKNLSAGNYRLKSYHNNPGGLGSTDLILVASVTGAVSAAIDDYDIPKTGEVFDANVGTGEVRFVATGIGDVMVSYIGADAPGYTKGIPFNAFELFSEPIEFTVVTPNGGEILNGGGTYEITWDVWGDINEVKIEYSVDNGGGWSEVDPPNTGNTGSYEWLVPEVDSNQCLVRVSDPNNSNVGDSSDGLFTIKPIIFVDANATGAGTGLSWQDAFNHLQDALGAAVSGVEIWVAQGTYWPDSNSSEPYGSGLRDASFQLLDSVELYGGFASGGSTWAMRDPNLYETILSGDLDGNDVEVNDPCDLGTEATRGENSLHVVTGGDSDPDRVLDGFSITGGNANGSSEDGRGGGIYSPRDGKATISNCILRGNFATLGGGMYTYNRSSHAIIDCTFGGNYALESGGGLYSSRFSDTQIAGCLFTGNRAGETGGAVTNFRIEPTFIDCTFTDNIAPQGGGTYDVISFSLFIGCEFSGNRAVDGGGAYLYDGTTTLANCTFGGNFAEGYGGAVVAYSSGEPVFSNCTLTDNFASEGNGLVFDSDGQSNPSNGELINCILWDGGGEIFNNDGSAISITFSDIQGGWIGLGNIDVDPCFVEAGYWVDVSDPNIIVEPNDANAVWTGGDYHLKSQGWRWDSSRGRWDYDEVTSRCIDAGSCGWLLNDEPLSVPDDPNNLWARNIRINMGAYGGTAQASMPPYDWSILSDMTNDGIIDFVDFSHLAAIFGDQGSQLYGDFDRNGEVDYRDLGLLCEDWLETTDW